MLLILSMASETRNTPRPGSRLRNVSSKAGSASLSRVTPSILPAQAESSIYLRARLFPRAFLLGLHQNRQPLQV